MNTRKRIASFFLAFAMILTFLPSIKVQADTLSDINIISNAPVTAKQAQAWAKSKGATDTFISLADLYWKYAEKCGGVNPGVAYVQAAKETGYGNFGGVLDESYHNPCGLKKSSGGGDYDPDAHQRFNSWDEGVQAHLDHLALYAGAAGYPKRDTYDPRHFVTIKGKATTVDSLGGNWAPSSTYGEEVNKLYNDLLTSAGVANNTNSEDKNQSTNNNGANNNSGNNSSSNNNSEVVVKPDDTPAPKGPTVAEPIKVPTGSEKNISSTIGWKYENSRWYYYKSDGSKATGWINPNNNWYYMYSDGQMATGWTKLGGKWYYMDPSSGKMEKGTVVDGWQIGPDGVMGNKVTGDTSKLIVIDPGHNFGGDDGAYSTHNGITYSERDLNMQTALKLKTKLEAKGYKVVLTRTESNRDTLPVTQSLTNRVNLANNLNADFFVSLHHNSADAQSAHGVETYYSSRSQDTSFGGASNLSKVSKSRSLATAINNSIVNKTGAYNRGAKDASLFVCRNTKMPAVLVELGFISNADEAVNCANSNYQNLLAQGIADAIASNL